LLLVTKRSDHLLREIEQDALNSNKSIGDALNKVIALGGRIDSTELRDWARRELEGYGPDDELPEYRCIVVPLQLDGATMHGRITGQQLSPWEPPDFAQDTISNDLEMRQGIKAIEGLVRTANPERWSSSARTCPNSSSSPSDCAILMASGFRHWSMT
jgi:hypothetical protein